MSMIPFSFKFFLSVAAIHIYWSRSRTLFLPPHCALTTSVHCLWGWVSPSLQELTVTHTYAHTHVHTDTHTHTHTKHSCVCVCVCVLHMHAHFNILIGPAWHTSILYFCRVNVEIVVTQRWENTHDIAVHCGIGMSHCRWQGDGGAGDWSIMSAAVRSEQLDGSPHHYSTCFLPPWPFVWLQGMLPCCWYSGRLNGLMLWQVV